jgi:hypothetical protein
MVSGYVADQDYAERVMAIRQGPPAPVTLQDYSNRSTGPLGEVTIRAEVDIRDLTIVQAPPSYGQGELCILPLYPVSDQGNALIGAARDAKSSPVSAQIARRLPVTQAPTRPLAVMVQFVPAGTSHPPVSELFTASFGNGRYGRVVEMNGLLHRDSDAVPLIEATFAGLGLTVPDKGPVVRPFSSDRLGDITADAVREAPIPFYELALLLFLGSIMVAAHERGYFDGLRVRRMRAEALRASVAASVGHDKSLHPNFAPIPTQEEIVARAIELEEELTTFQRQFPILSSLIESLGDAIRNRQTRREA